MADLSLNGSLLVALSAVCGLVPALFWLWFWLKEDGRRPEPRRMIWRVFIFGGLVVALASILERSLIRPEQLSGGASLLGVVLVLSLIEEVVKYGAAYWGALRSHYFDEPVDAMVYMITAALGFAAVENTLFLLSTLWLGQTINLDFFLTGNFRFIGATIVHVVTSAIVGGFLGLAFYQPRLKRAFFIILGLTSAVVLHALFNYFIIKSDGAQILQVFVVLWLAALFVIYFFEKVKANVHEQKTILF